VVLDRPSVPLVRHEQHARSRRSLGPASLGLSQLGALSAFIVIVGLVCGVAGAALYAYLRKDLTLVVAGEATRKLTFKRTVGEVLAESGITLSTDDEVSPTTASSLQSGQTVIVRRAVPVTIAVDGKRLHVRSAAPTVADTLQRAGIALNPLDRVTPSTQTPIAPNAEIHVVRVAARTIAEQIVIQPPIKSSIDPSLPRGVVRVLQEGRVGVRERSVKVTQVDGKVIRRDLLAERVIRAPRDRFIAVGSKVLIVKSGDFAGREYMDMVATAYAPYCCVGVRSRTSIGLQAGHGVVAVDPTIIPLGSYLFIEGYGQAIAGDVGGDIKGLRIDLGFATTREALRYGRRAVRVYILTKK